MTTHDTTPERSRSWALSIDPPVATLTLRPSGSNVEFDLADALESLRFEYPQVGLVVIRGDIGDRFRRALEDGGGDPAGGLAVACETAGAPGAGERERGPASEAVGLGPLRREEYDGGFAYPNVRVDLDRAAGEATLTIVGPSNHECFAPEPGPMRLRSRWWPLAVRRELDDALHVLRGRRPGIRRLVLRTEGDPLAVASADVALTSGYDHDWFVREVVLSWKRTLRRLDNAEHPVIAVVEPGSCFVGTLLELALTAGVISMVDAPEAAGSRPPEIFLTGMNFGPLPRADGLTRLEYRLRERSGDVAALASRVGDPIAAADAAELGLVTDAVGGHAPGVSGTSR